ncbi:chromosome segregation protein SMC [Desulfatiferula olefinivorans]
MRLIKLDIAGFKSFQEKVSLVFPRGITAVVGPNGCGKSNIVDALRWVMGEQSVKQLRGKAVEDLIFAGADGKQPLNMAEVSLTIDNSGGDAAESTMNPYTEIMITRRIYRSGESAYLINRQPCRLKDIHNLFLGSGSGKHSFAVIQQGNIGALTDAGPEERRFFIEDAADITKFKERKKETLSRIKSTEENLLRLSDIITELKRRIESLDRQAAKAKKFKEYRSRARDLDIRIALWYFDRYSRDISAKRTACADLSEAEERRSRELIEIDARLSGIARDAARQREIIEDLEQQRFDLQRAVDKKENDREHLTRDIDRLGREMIDAEAHAEELDRKNQELAREIEQARSSHEGLDDDLIRAESELAGEREARDTLKTQLQDLEKSVKDLHRQHMVLAGDQARAGSILDHARQREIDLDRRLRRIDEDFLDSSRRLDEARNEKKQADLALEELRLTLRDLSRDRDRVRGELARHAADHTDRRAALRTLDMEHSGHRSRYTTLAAIHDQFGWYQKGVKTVMKTLNKDGNVSAQRLVAERLRPAPGYEAAAEAVLAEALQAVLVDAPEEALDLIDHLRTQREGQCGFLVRLGLRPPPASPVPEGCTSLIDHMDLDDDDRNLARTLLANALVVPSLAAGLSLPDHRGPRVTLDGDLITERGLIIGGSRDTDNSIFHKKQEIEELEALIRSMEARQRDLRQDLDRLDQAMSALRAEEQGLGDALNDAETEKQEAERAQLLSEETLKQAKKRRTVLELEQEQLAGEREDIEQEISELSDRLQHIGDDIRVIEGRLESSAATVTDVSSLLEARNKAVVDLQVRITSLAARRDNHRTSLKRLEGFLFEGQKRKSRLEQEMFEKKERSEQISRTLDADRGLLDQLAKDLARTAEEDRVARNGLAAIEASRREKERLRAERLKERDRDNGRLQALELELSQLRLKRESLTARIEEKYHHRINQYSLEFEEKEVDTASLSAFDITAMETELKDLTRKITQLGDVNLSAISEFEELKTRYDFLIDQQNDLTRSLSDLEAIIAKINRVSQERFLETFNLINDKLGELFPTLFEGGSARMVLTEPSSPLTTGVELMIQPPGKRLTRLSLLSGGEKALSAIAFVFSIFLIKPSSFCIMDEIDAPLDDANVMRFNALVRHIGKQSQILMITHNKLTMEFADILFGVTMEKKGVSKIVSVNLSGLPDPEQDRAAVA